MLRWCCHYSPACASGDRSGDRAPGPTVFWPTKAYSSRAIRAHLRARELGSVIPEPDDQKAHR
jgi:hypothetical protein